MKLEVSIGVLKANAPAVRRWKNKGRILGRDVEWGDVQELEVNDQGAGMIVLPPSMLPRFIKVVGQELAIEPGKEDA